MTRRTHSIRKAIVGAVLAAAVVASVSGPAPAGAAVNATLETVSSTTSCNSVTRTITFGASITLSGAYANGAYVAYRFRYFQVNASGARTTPFYGGNWLGPVFVDTWTQTMGIMGPIAMNNPVHLNGGSVTWAGRLHAHVEIAVWTGRSYVYTGWMDITSSYTNHYPTSLGMEVATLSDCLTAW